MTICIKPASCSEDAYVANAGFMIHDSVGNYM